MTSCSEAQFGSGGSDAPSTSTGSSTSTETTDTPVPPSTPPPSTPDCIKGDFVSFKYEEQVQKCIDEDKMWNFEFKQCTNMPKASFKCTFDEFFAQMNRIGMTPSPVLQDGKDGKS